MSISQNTALFSLLGTQFGGDGVTTFALPDLRGRAPMHQGQGPGLTPRVMGEESGSETVTLISTEMPMHNHMVNAFNGPGDNQFPTGNYLAGGADNTQLIYTNVLNGGVLNPQTIGLAGGNQPHENMQPYLVINMCIALEGIFPSRN
jgi:microcystin-dependent protein